MKTIITSFAVQTVAEGKRITASYSVINEAGEYIKQNQRFTYIVTDEKSLESIDSLTNMLSKRIPE